MYLNVLDTTIFFSRLYPNKQPDFEHSKLGRGRVFLLKNTGALDINNAKKNGLDLITTLTSLLIRSKSLFFALDIISLDIIDKVFLFAKRKGLFLK